MKYLRHPVFRVIVIVWLIFWIGQILYSRFWSQVPTQINFDAVSSLFNALAFAGIIITILLEQESRVVDNFQTNFFNLLSMHNDLVKDLSVSIWKPGTTDTSVYRGREIFKPYVEGFGLIHVPTKTEEDDEQMYQNNFDSQHQNFQGASAIDRYFQSLNSILKFIEKSELPEPRKEVYFEIISSHLTDEEWASIQYRARLYYQKGKTERLKRVIKYLGTIQIHDSHSHLFDGFEKVLTESDVG